MIGCIDTLYTPLGTTDNYSAIADLHTLQFTVTHALKFSVFTSHILATDIIIVSLSVQTTHEVFFSQPYSLLAISFQSPSTADSLNISPAAPELIPAGGVSRNSTEFLSITTLQGPRRKHNLSIVEKACLQRRCIATEVIQLLLVYSL
jgi:hypothetical protein